MQAVRQGDVDGVDRRIVDQLGIRIVHPRDAVPPGESMSAGLVAGSHGRDDDIREFAGRTNERHRRDPGGAQNTEANGRSHARLPSPSTQPVSELAKRLAVRFAQGAWMRGPRDTRYYAAHRDIEETLLAVRRGEPVVETPLISIMGGIDNSQNARTEGRDMASKVLELLGSDADSLLKHQCRTIPKESLHLPGPDFVERIFAPSDRSPRVLVNLERMIAHGRLSGTGYMSILPVDQGVEHSAGALFAPNPAYFDPRNIVKLAVEGGCNAVASTFGVLGLCAREFAHRIPFIVKINHNELLTYPNKHDQIFFGTVERAYDMGAAAVGATIYFGSEESSRQIIEVSQAFSLAHELGMATILWCYLRNSAFTTPKQDFHTSADLTGQADHLGATLQADIVKQKLPTNNGGYTALKFGKTSPLVYEKLTTDHPIDLCRYQVANGYMGRIGLINSGGASEGAADLAEAVRTAVINKCCRWHRTDQRSQGF